MGRGLILIRQLASRGRLSPKTSFRAYPVLAAVSNCYPGHEGRLSTRYSPVRHSTRGRSHFRVRLACVKHAASVQSEPESNSPVQICIKIPAWQKSESQRLFLPTRYSLVNEPPGLPTPPLSRRGPALCTLSPPPVNDFLSVRENFFATAESCCSVTENEKYPDASSLSTTFCKNFPTALSHYQQNHIKHGMTDRRTRSHFIIPEKVMKIV